jgi:putative transposase
VAQKKTRLANLEERRTWVDLEDNVLSVRRQCELLGLSRSGLYYEPRPESALNLDLMNRIDRIYTAHPFYGSRRIETCLERELDRPVSRKLVQRLMRLMGIQAIYPKPRTTMPHPEHKVYPYLLRELAILRPNQVWSTDITYVGLSTGFIYVTAVIDWFTRYVLAWGVSNTMDVDFCLDVLDRALDHGTSHPDIFNTDQGSQYTSCRFTGLLEEYGIRVSMDGRGRALDNVFVERLWRSYKYEEVYLNEYNTVLDAVTGCDNYFPFYNSERPHQSLNNLTPAEMYL